jgi:hypothetical protein
MDIYVEFLDFLNTYVVEQPYYVIAGTCLYMYSSMLLKMNNKSMIAKRDASKIVSGPVLSVGKNQDDNLSIDILLEYVDHKQKDPIAHKLVFETNCQYLTEYEKHLRSLSLGLIPFSSPFKGKYAQLTDNIKKGMYLSMPCLPKSFEESVVLSFGKVYSSKQEYLEHHNEE